MITANLQHRQNTAGAFDYANQAAVLTSLADVVNAQEVSPGDLPNWDAAFASRGFNRTPYVENSPQMNDGQVIWYKASKVTVNSTYSRKLSNGFIGWDGSTNVDKSAVAIDVTVANKRALIVDTHLCWSRCADTQADVITGKSWQRDAQARELLDWVSGLGHNNVILGGDFDFTPLFPQYPLFGNYIDAWKLGLQTGTATAPWSDRDGDGLPDMPRGELTTRTHDTRRIDYVFLQGGVGLISIELPDLRKPCTLVNGQCPGARNDGEFLTILASGRAITIGSERLWFSTNSRSQTSFTSKGWTYRIARQARRRLPQSRVVMGCVVVRNLHFR